jgi:aspartate aminotransferase/aminotransferase
MLLSDRVMQMRPSGVRKIFDLAQKVKNPINLSIGEPDFDIPDAVKDEGIKWIQKGFNKYTPSGGIPELREKVLGHLRGKGIVCEDAIITAGVTGGLLLALMTTLNPGDEVIIPDPISFSTNTRSSCWEAGPSSSIPIPTSRSGRRNCAGR